MIRTSRLLAAVLVCILSFPASAAMLVDRGDQETVLKTDLYTVVFSSRGGGITSYKLVESKYGLDLVRPPAAGGPACLALMSPGHPGGKVAVENALSEQEYSEVDIESTDGETVLTFEYRLLQQFRRDKSGSVKLGGAPQTILVKKVYRFNEESYRFIFSLDFSVPAEQELTSGSFVFGWYPGLGSGQPVDDKAGFLEDNEFEDVKPGGAGEFKFHDMNSRLVGMIDTYYAAVFVPRKPLSEAKLAMWRSPEEKKDILGGVQIPVFELANGENITFEYEAFIGPKEEHRLQGVLGCLKQQGRIVPHILRALKYLHSLTNSWGWSIILLTILIRVVLLPLTIKQAQNMAKMQAIQPELNAIRARCKDDPQRMNQETIKLYRDKQVNPLGGCLPAFVQIPILFALFWALRNSIELKGSGFLWIQDLSSPDRSFALFGYMISIPLLPILTAATAYWQQKQMSSNPQQSKMMAFFPVMMFVFSYSLPSGVVLYWFISNLLSTFQQKVINSRMSAAPAVVPAAAAQTESKKTASKKTEVIGDAPPSDAQASEESLQKKETKKKKRKRRKKKK